jgi:hypothetical protein
LNLLGTIAVGEKTVVADAHEALGENVEQEPSEELDGMEGHFARASLLGVVLVAEGDLSIGEGEKSMVGDGDSVGVAGEVFEDLVGSAERGLRIDDPVLVP